MINSCRCLSVTAIRAQDQRMLRTERVMEVKSPVASSTLCTSLLLFLCVFYCLVLIPFCEVA